MTLAWNAGHLVDARREFFRPLKREGRLHGGLRAHTASDALALRELLAPACLMEADLLAFDFARIARDEPRLR